MNPRPLLELMQLGKTYPTPQGPAVIVRDVNLKIAEGEFVCLIGHSGCGKSTVLSIVMGLNEPTTGSAILGMREIDGPGTDRGVVFQSPSLFPWLTVEQNIQLAVDQVKPRLSPAERLACAKEALAQVGLAGEADRHPAELSAGMRQRAGIARALAMDPKILLLDEPFSLLDALTRMELQDELLRIWEQHRKTVLMVTHDVDEALLLADRIVMMTNGPAATIGRIMTVPFARPRVRAQLADNPEYYRARDSLIAFLEGQGNELPKEEQCPA